jgi:hypothetical protein
VGVFSSDGTIPEDGLRIVIENFRKSMNIARQVALNEVSDTNPLREAQRELGIPHLFPPPHRDCVAIDAAEMIVA